MNILSRLLSRISLSSLASMLYLSVIQFPQPISRLKRVAAAYGPRVAILLSVPFINFAFLSTVAHVMTTREFGLLSLVFAVNAAISIIIAQPIAEGIARFFNDSVRSGKHGDLLRTTLHFFIRAAAFVVVCCVTFLVLCPLLGVNISLLSAWSRVAIISYFVTYMLLTIASAYFNIKADYFRYVIVAFGVPALGTFSALMLALAHRTDTGSILAAQSAVAATIISITLLHRLTRIRSVAATLLRSSHESERQFMANFAHYIAPQFMISFTLFSFMFADRFVVARYFSLTEVAQYTYIFILTMNIVFAVGNAYAGSTYYTSLEKLARARSQEEALRVYRQFIAISLALPVLFAPLPLIYTFFDQQIVRLAFGTHANTPPWTLTLMAISASLFACTQQITLAANLIKKQRSLVIPRWLVAGGFIGGLFLFHKSLLMVCFVALTTNIVGLLVVAVIVLRFGTRKHAAAWEFNAVPQL